MARPAPKPRKYEMMIVVAPTVTEDGLPAVVERVSGMVEEQGGTIESASFESPWGHRRLAYPIQNFRDAFYVLFYFQCAPRGLSEIERELRLDAAVIRHLVVKFDPLTVRDGEGEGAAEGGAPAAEVEAEAETGTAASTPPAQEESAAPASEDAENDTEEETPDSAEASDDEEEAEEEGEDEAGDGEDEDEDGEDNEA